eukprot:TRINITY_DN40104_c1_g2_i1.p1 TRINITY_DN40104_c1_g2~~TRINITY_DN40104_c1_g2_i1.p1  ORF type:complete len:152 (+),score=10.55 TRINITY_DN40104_c1_g2_i1:316-771(+)
MNRALLGKWLWNIGEHSNSLWRQLVMAKYTVKRNGWEVSGPSYRFSGIWRGISSVRDLFTANVKYKIALGEDVTFWLGVWVGDRPLAKEFNYLFRCASNKLAKVRDYMEKINDYCLDSNFQKTLTRRREERAYATPWGFESGFGSRRGARL